MLLGVQFEPFLPPWILIAGFFLSAAVVFLSYWRRLRQQESLLVYVFLLFKIGALVVLVFMLARPVTQTRRKEKVHTVLPVLLDASESMGVEDQAGTTRFNKARDLILYHLSKQLSEDFDLRLYTFGSFLEPQTEGTLAAIPAAYGSSTDIGGAVIESLRREGKRVDALVLLSDGVHNLGTHPAEITPALKQQGVRVYTVGIGQAGDYKDVEIGSISVPTMVFMNEEVPVTFDIRSYGYKSVSAEVILQGTLVDETTAKVVQSDTTAAAKGNTMVLARQTVELTEKFPQERGKITFTIGERGTYQLTLSTQVLADERVTSNNQKQVEVHVTRERMQVLFLEGRPRWGYGFLVRALRSDPRIALHAVLEIAEGTFYHQRTGKQQDQSEKWDYPKRTTDLKDVDLLILGDVSPKRFGEEGLKAIVDAVSEKGMSVVLVAGESSFGQDGFYGTPMEAILPAELKGEQQVLPSSPLSYFVTPEGTNHPVFRVSSDPIEMQALLGNLPEMGAYWPLGKARPAALVLMTGKTDAAGDSPILLAVQKYGRGRTAILATDEWYRWSFMKGSDQPGQVLLRRFWQGFVRWIIMGDIEDKDALAISLEQEQYIQGKEIEIKVRHSSFDATGANKPVLWISSPDFGQKQFQLEPMEAPGWYRVAFLPSVLGAYKLLARVEQSGKEPLTAEREFRVEPYVMEQRSAGMNEQLLRSLSTDTGGLYFSAENVTDLPRTVPKGEKEVERTITRQLWNSPMLYGLLFLLMSTEWIWRRLRDLP